MCALVLWAIPRLVLIHLPGLLIPCPPLRSWWIYPKTAHNKTTKESPLSISRCRPMSPTAVLEAPLFKNLCLKVCFRLNSEHFEEHRLNNRYICRLARLRRTKSAPQWPRTSRGRRLPFPPYVPGFLAWVSPSTAQPVATVAFLCFW